MALHEVECMRRRLAGIPVEICTRNVFSDTPELSWLDGVQGMVIGGSGAFSVHDSRSLGWVTELRHVLDRCLEAKIPSFGICFGHQLLGLHLGADVVTDLNRREVGTQTFQLTPTGMQDPLFGPLACGADPSFMATTGHTDHITHHPPGTLLLATNSVCPIEALKVEGAPFYSSQFHPDLNGGEARARYLSFASGIPEAERGEVEDMLSRFDPTPYPAETLLASFVSKLAQDAG